MGLIELVALLLIAVWIATLVNVIRTPQASLRVGTQIMWLIIVIFVPLIGVPLYWIMAAPRRGSRPY